MLDMEKRDFLIKYNQTPQLTLSFFSGAACDLCNEVYVCLSFLLVYMTSSVFRVQTTFHSSADNNSSSLCSFLRDKILHNHAPIHQARSCPHGSSHLHLPSYFEFPISAWLWIRIWLPQKRSYKHTVPKLPSSATATVP